MAVDAGLIRPPLVVGIGVHLTEATLVTDGVGTPPVKPGVLARPTLGVEGR
ncbi:hypothetical protein [Streptomyces sp. NPDC001500]